ncbi:hypothetical protein [Streptomyces abyssalis]|uniref:hypothetical protein n=1 Tax=Streptomyces abyssalis TaxID=933944 RepID=UPI001112D0F5|nr:hypothetical protein [Streptomyces abyssalis]
MQSTNSPPALTGYVTYWCLRTEGPEVAEALAEAASEVLRRLVPQVPRFRSARVHLSLDGDTTVVRAEWAAAPDDRQTVRTGELGRALAELADRPGVLSATVSGGFPGPGIEGPASGEPPGLVAVATRHVGGPRNAEALSELLLRSGEWKRDFPGFISAQACVSGDGSVYVNYPQWVDGTAYRAYMDDPRNAAGQGDIAVLEVAPPEVVLCTVLEQIDAANPRISR